MLTTFFEKGGIFTTFEKKQKIFLWDIIVKIPVYHLKT